ncbi:hypothetical protein GCM10028820_06650 [Tessaracoccus terricola]
MREPLLSIGVATTLLLTACSAGAGPTPVEEALASELIGMEGYVAMAFVDARGIRETVGREPVDLTQSLNTESWDEADRWAVGVVLDVVPSGSADDRIIPSTNVDWVYHGLNASVMKAPDEMHEATREHTSSSGWNLQFHDELIVLQTGGVAWEPAVDESMLDTPTAQALLPCLEGAHVVSMLAASPPFVENAFATAARVDEDAQGHAWSCVWVPDGAQDYADSLESERISSITVEDDVVRVELTFEANDGPIPAEAAHARSGARTLRPGF